jgi:hypothetical protein
MNMKNDIGVDAAHSRAFLRKEILKRRLISAIPMNKILIAALLSILSLPAISHAQTTDAMSLTITPPFFDLNVDPGDLWSSSIRVVNTNASAMQVHAVVMGFAASDDFGHGNFIPLSQLAGDTDALGNWITVSSSLVTVPSDGAVEVPFSVSVPSGASPGGHYGAILIGTGGGSVASSSGSQVGISSFISALVFVRVSGNVVESAQVSDFSADKPYYQTPDVHFTVRIQNTGNAQIRPVGMIQIYNAFGKERGEVSINGTGTLGYILSSSSREFDVEWQGQPSLLDIGPYTAILSLAYGENGTKSMSRAIGFWVLPIDQLVEVALSIIIAAMAAMYLLRRVVRKMLASEMEKFGGHPKKQAEKETQSASDDGTIHLRYPHKK